MRVGFTPFGGNWRSQVEAWWVGVSSIWQEVVQRDNRPHWSGKRLTTSLLAVASAGAPYRVLCAHGVHYTHAWHVLRYLVWVVHSAHIRLCPRELTTRRVVDYWDFFRLSLRKIFDSFNFFRIQMINRTQNNGVCYINRS